MCRLFSPAYPSVDCVRLKNWLPVGRYPCLAGSATRSVTQLLRKATEVAGKNKVKLAAENCSWSAMELSSFHAKMLPFEINKMTTLAVLSSLRSAAVAVEAAN